MPDVGEQTWDSTPGFGFLFVSRIHSIKELFTTGASNPSPAAQQSIFPQTNIILKLIGSLKVQARSTATVSFMKILFWTSLQRRKAAWKPQTTPDVKSYRESKLNPGGLKDWTSWSFNCNAGAFSAERYIEPQRHGFLLQKLHFLTVSHCKSAALRL